MGAYLDSYLAVGVIVLTGIVLASPHTQRRYFVALYVPAATLVALLVRRPAPPDKR